MLRIVLTLVLIAASAFRASCADPIQEAVDKHSAAVESAKRPVLVAYSDLILAANKSGDAAGANRLTEFSERFTSSGIIYFPDPGGSFPVIIKEYGKAIKKAGDDLQDVYRNEMTAAASKQDFARLNSLTSELESHRLPGKLISLQTQQANQYLNHWGLLLRAGKVDSEPLKANATFELRPGLTNSEFVSIHSINFPTHYVAHSGFRVQISDFLDSADWKRHATWIKVPGLADPKSGISFKALTHPDRVIRVRPNGEVWLDPIENNAAFSKSATFLNKPGVWKLW